MRRLILRNTLGLWGVGSKTHDVFLDGKTSEDCVLSQFGTRPPLVIHCVTAVHLPAVEIRETLEEDAFVEANKNESLEGAGFVSAAIMANLRWRDTSS